MTTTETTGQGDVNAGPTAEAITESQRTEAAALGWEVLHRLRDLGDDIVELEVPSPIDLTSALAWHPLAIEHGDLGMALVYSAAAEAAPEDGWDLLAHRHLARAVETFSNSPGLGVGLFSGTAAVAYTISALSRGGERYSGALEQVESQLLLRSRALVNRLDPYAGVATDDYDLVSGLAGVAWYALRSGRDGVSSTLLEMCVEALSRRAVVAAPGGYWTPPDLITDVERRVHPHLRGGYVNLGLAHGVAGPLMVLGAARRSGLDVRPDAIDALERALAEHFVDSGHGPDIGYHAVPGAPSIPTPTRAAWCYGNPGLALAAAESGPSNQLPSARAMLSALDGRGESELAIDNPSLCHGYAGLAVIEHAVTGCASQSTVDRLLALRDLSTRFGLVNKQIAGTHTDTPGFLEGAGGAALALLTISGVTPDGTAATQLLTGRGLR